MTVTIYHNPRCSKSRQTLALLEERGVTPAVVEYLVHPPTPETIQSFLSALNMQPRELMRRKEAAYKENNLADETLSPDALVQAMHDFPILIERPIVVNGSKVAVGRPPEDVLEIL